MCAATAPSGRGLGRVWRNLELGHRNLYSQSRFHTTPPICRRCREKTSIRIKAQSLPLKWVRRASTRQFEEPSKLLSALPKTHYEFFPQTLAAGPPPAGPFVIDIRQLRREFLQLQAVAHPDRHPPDMKLKAEGTSARINEAYKVLQNPLLRAQYLLFLKGVNVAEDETAKVEDPELLMEVLETREEIEAAQEEVDLDKVLSVNNERIQASEKVLDEAFRSDDIELAKSEAVKLRYWINIKDSLDAWEPGKPVILQH